MVVKLVTKVIKTLKKLTRQQKFEKFNKSEFVGWIKYLNFGQKNLNLKS